MADASKPDGAYADPGYQADKKPRYPIDSEEHCRAAWSYINQADNASKYSAEQLSSIKGRIKAAGGKYGITFESASRSYASGEHPHVPAGSSTGGQFAATGGGGKVTPEFLKTVSDMKSLPAHHVTHHAKRGEDLIDVSEFPTHFVRSFALQDIAIRSGGNGRTVEAYAAVFDTPAEIVDGQGHYTEVIDRAAFNRTIANNAQRVGVFYNHGMNLYGTPSDRFSIPIGTPEEIRADSRGLLTVTRYNNTPQADEVLEAIRSGGIAGYSFTGRLIRSDPNRPPAGGYGRGRDGALRTVRRFELGLQEYGPTPMPAYNEAAIVGVRAALREELRALLSSTPDGDPADSFDTSVDTEPVADDPHSHSVRQSPFARRLSVALTARGIRSDGNEAAGHRGTPDGDPR